MATKQNQPNGRRDFLKVSGAIAASASVVANASPVLGGYHHGVRETL